MHPVTLIHRASLYFHTYPRVRPTHRSAVGICEQACHGGHCRRESHNVHRKLIGARGNAILRSEYAIIQGPMRPSEVFRAHRDLIRHVVEAHRARNARVFGSVLHGKDKEGSDLDVLIDPLPGATLLDLGAIQIELEEALGVSVDVLTPGDLPAKFRARVLDEAIPV